MTDPIVIIGTGVGGLSAAIRLAAAGHPVHMLEAAPGPGGKAGSTTLEGVQLDTGPSVLTLPEVFDELFRSAGTSLKEQVTLRQPDPAFRYIYPDGVQLDMHHDLGASLESVRTTLGEQAAREFETFLAYAQKIWQAGAPNFVFGAAPSIGSLLRMSVTRLGDLNRIDAGRTMWAAIKKHTKDPHLQWLFARYATYNGSNVHSAPATLNCIAWVELGLGGFGVQGGIQALIEAMVRVAEGLGVTFEYDTPAKKIAVLQGRAVGVHTERGLVRAQAVVANADAAHVREDLLQTPLKRALPEMRTPSTSGWNAILKAKVPDQARAPHAVLFPKEYDKEFQDLFDFERAPRDPAIYLCAQSLCHGRDRWRDAEPLFVMANAPAEPSREPRPGKPWQHLKDRVLARLQAAGLIDPSDPMLWQRTPSDLAQQFPGSRGALYGSASNSMFSAFQRPCNEVSKVPGLYLASGSAHPGGGLPLCALSGAAAAQAFIEQSARTKPKQRRGA